MLSIKDFKHIKEYLAYTNLLVGHQIDDFIVYDFRQVNDDAEMTLRGYRHHFYEITLEVSNGCVFEVDQFKFSGANNLLSIIGPRRLQSVEVHQATKAFGNGYTLFFSPDFLPQLARHDKLANDFPFLRPSVSPAIQLNKQTIQEVVNLFGLIKYEHDQYGPASLEVIRAYLAALLAKGRQHYQPADAPVARTREQELAQAFEELSQAHFLRHTTVAEYADLLNISPKHLSESVKKAIGQNALDIINGHRINFAKSLLRQTDLPPSRIGDELGFANQAYFFTFFKKHTGVTPSQFRQI